MVLEYEILRPDWAHAMEVIATTRKRPAWLLRQAPLATVTLGLILLVVHDDIAGWIAPAALALAGLVWAIGSTWYSHAGMDQMWADASKSLRPVRLEVTEAGITFWTAVGESRLSWQAFDHFAETRDLFLLYTSPTEIRAFIPKRCLATPQRLEEFRRWLGDSTTPAATRLLQERKRGFEVITKPVAGSGSDLNKSA